MPGPTLASLIDNLDAALAAQDASLTRAVDQAFVVVERRLADDLAALTREIAAARSAGQDVTAVWLLQQKRLADLLAQAEQLMGPVIARVQGATEAAQWTAAIAAEGATQQLVLAGMQVPAGASFDLNRLPAEQIAALVGVAYDGSPLADLLGHLPAETAQQIRDELVAGLAAGDNPRDVADRFAAALAGGRAQAERIARTEMLNAYRSAQLAAYRANSDVVRGWSWHAAAGCCAECQAKNGQEHPLSDPFDEHPNGRCAPLPITRTWQELGITMSMADDIEAAHAEESTQPDEAADPGAETQPGGLVTRRGPLFKLGRYPDKQFALDAAEAQQAIQEFRPVPIDVEHAPSVLDGKLGTLRGVELRGDMIHGEIAVPAWLDRLFPGQPIPVSATWSRDPKRIIRLALAKTPRVSEAAMMAAFSAADAAQEQPLMEDPRPLSRAWWAALFGGAQDAGLTPAAFAAEPTTTPAQPAQPDPEVERLRRELAQAHAQRIAAEAAAFADAEIAAHRAVPAERAAMVAALSQAAVDDGAHGVVTFADGKTTSRAAQIRALYAARPAHVLTQELVPDATFAVPAKAETEEDDKAGPPDPTKAKRMSAKRKAELLEASAVGRAVLSAAQK